jgi:hypothetical protein
MAEVEDVIREAKKRTNDGSDKNKRHKKKRKREEDDSIEEQDEKIIELKNDAIRKLELKNLMLKYPNVDIADMESIEKVVSSLSGDDLKCYLDNVKYKVGLTSPNETSKSLVGLAGLFLAKWTKNGFIHNRLINDIQLTSAAEHLLPSSFGEYNTILQVAYRISGHISDIMFGQNNFSNKEDAGGSSD